MKYNWQQPDWPRFTYNAGEVNDTLLAVAEEAGLSAGMAHGIPDALQTETIIGMMVTEAIKTSEIEGEYLSRPDVLSSIRNNLGVGKKAQVKDRKAQGAGNLMVDVRNTYTAPLTREKLWEWHIMLMAGSKGIETGKWRTHAEPMQVVSGAYGKQKVHFEAPPSAQVPREMDRFIKWFNDTAPGGKKEIKQAVIRAAVAHLYFESIHPFEDGNGRIGRAIAEKALSQTSGRPLLLSLSAAIEADKKAYYHGLETGQKKNEVTPWVKYFASTTLAAYRQARAIVAFTLKKTKFFDRFGGQLNERELKVLRKMFDAGPAGFTGGMNAAKYVSIAKTSKATATRDLQHLAEIQALLPRGGGRSTHYVLGIEEGDW